MAKAVENASWFVYVLVNAAGRTYVGITRGPSPDRRLAEHNGKRQGAKSTKGLGPWRLCYAEKAEDRGLASSREWKLKRERHFRKRIAENGRRLFA